MKKILCFLVMGLGLSFGVKAQYVTIPDTAFLADLKFNYPANFFNAAGQLDTSLTNDISLSSSYDFYSTYDTNITNLQGIQYLRRK